MRREDAGPETCARRTAPPACHTVARATTSNAGVLDDLLEDVLDICPACHIETMDTEHSVLDVRKGHRPPLSVGVVGAGPAGLAVARALLRAPPTWRSLSSTPPWQTPCSEDEGRPTGRILLVLC